MAKFEDKIKDKIIEVDGIKYVLLGKRKLKKNITFEVIHELESFSKNIDNYLANPEKTGMKEYLKDLGLL